MATKKPYRVAIACQGGGSHTAFTAGALRSILRNQKDAFEIVALSGTSGGAICAFLTWYGLLKGDAGESIQLLEDFWADNSADTGWELLLNAAVVIGQSQQTRLEFSPYWFPEWGREMLESVIKKRVDFDAIPSLIRKNSPALLVSAVDVCSGEFRVFRNQEVTINALLASAAIPTLFQAAEVDGAFYWDGLFSQNPPIRDLAKAKPDRLWVIQINPQTREDVPRTMDEIRDRRNELSGNLSLNQEVDFIEKINDFVRNGHFSNGPYKEIDVKRVRMERDLPYASKLDRNPEFIDEMMAYGETQAEQLFS